MAAVLMVCAPPASARQPSAELPPPIPARAFLYSAILPGAGQYVAGQRRWSFYMAADLVMWIALADQRRGGHRLADAYRDLAWAVARGRPDPRRDGDWDYYEKLAKYGASGRLDADAGREGVQPESDPTTHNGAIWALARDLYFPGGVEPAPGDPAWDRALDYYLRRGVPEAFSWDWRSNDGARTTYDRLIADSDRHLRRSVGFAGILLANRVLSVVDLFVASRVGFTEGPPLDLHLDWDPVGQRPWLLMSIPTR